MGSKEHTCCFFGHRKIAVTDDLVSRLNDIVEDLIVEKKVDHFYLAARVSLISFVWRLLRR